ncbi:Haloacid dehalogenase-like hydrolase superfamily protein [Perilla frutescens var. frutescens]|nr:Haloacid dehalogenase-like hydrolase superfamily protein [Perilla frutescens var. frutescens]
MIYKKWSLLTGHTSLIVGVIDTIVVADLQFAENQYVEDFGDVSSAFYRNWTRANCDDVKENKPHPIIYVTAAKRLGVSEKDCLVVEDSVIGLQIFQFRLHVKLLTI